MKVVVDASVAVKWILKERPAEADLKQAAKLLEAIDNHGVEVFEPPHWSAEVLAVVVRLDPAAIDDTIILLHDIRPHIISDVEVLRAAARLAAKLDHHLFDTLYHAVALDRGATLVTADKRYFEKAKSEDAIALLADFTL
ncbi:MAG: type II toxin-antitoxin system VapC family toxin [Hyphomicrobiaceae bacterium]